MRSLLSFKRFLNELNWPEESFAAYLDQKVAAICADRFQEAAEEYEINNEKLYRNCITVRPLYPTPLFYTSILHPGTPLFYTLGPL